MTRSNSKTYRGAAADRQRLATGIPVLDDIVTRSLGSALPLQQPSLRITPTQALVTSIVALGFSAISVIWLATELSTGSMSPLAALFPLLLAELTLVGRLRVQQVVIAHHAVHRSFCAGHEWSNKLIAEICTLLTVSQNPNSYRKDHVGGHHRPKIFASAQDPDAAFLLSLALKPGMSRRALYRRLTWTLFSPDFHARFALARLRSNFVDATLSRQVMVAVWLAFLVYGGCQLGLIAGLLTIVLPLGPLYQMSALLQFTSEHRWLSGDFDPKDAQAYADRCQARVALAPLPSAELSGMSLLFAWIFWIPMQTIELLFRLSVTVGDLTVHDFHHVQGIVRRRVAEWPQTVFERQAAIDAGDTLGLSLREAHGWKAAFDWVFDGMAANSN